MSEFITYWPKIGGHTKTKVLKQILVSNLVVNCLDQQTICPSEQTLVLIR